MRFFVRAILFIFGLSHLLVSALTFFAPAWFFANIGHFPPFNAHFLADIGAFNAPLGVGLLIAARAPERHRLLVGLAALGNLLHSFSHLRDGYLHIPPNMPLLVGLTQQALLLLTGIVLLAIAARGGPAAATARAASPQPLER